MSDHDEDEDEDEDDTGRTVVTVDVNITNVGRQPTTVMDVAVTPSRDSHRRNWATEEEEEFPRVVRAGEVLVTKGYPLFEGPGFVVVTDARGNEIFAPVEDATDLEEAVAAGRLRLGPQPPTEPGNGSA
jgi:hypothetical protein